MKPYLLTDVPEDIWDALRDDAASRETPEKFTNDAGRSYPSQRMERTGTSLNNVVASVLAAKYGLEFEPTNRATFRYEQGRNRFLYLRLPEHIMDAVNADAAESTKRAAILLALAEYYLLPLRDDAAYAQRVKHGRPKGRKAKA